MKVLIVANTSWYLFNFRFNLIKKLSKNKFSVFLAAPLDRYTKRFSKLSVQYKNWDIKRASINPLNEIIALIRLSKIYKRISPKLVHHFTIKAAIYGTTAAKINKTKYIINSITGLGPLFTRQDWKMRIIRFLLIPIISFLFNSKNVFLIFQNKDDLKFFLSKGLVKKNNAKLIRGSGIDIKKFKPKNVFLEKRKSLKKNSNSNIFKILFPSRILKEKGFFELLEAFYLLRKENLNVKLYIAGSLDKGNSSSLNLEELNELQKNKRIIFLGHVKKMKRVYADVDCVVLPSWREGLSKSLLEAASMSKPIVATDVPGCRDIVINGETGLLVPKKDINSIKNAIKYIMRNPNLAYKMGLKARTMVSNKFNTKLVNYKTINLYKKILDN